MRPQHYLMLKFHRVALRPTSEQESLFLQHAGFARFAYNWAVGEFEAGLEVGKWLTERSSATQYFNPVLQIHHVLPGFFNKP